MTDRVISKSTVFSVATTFSGVGIFLFGCGNALAGSVFVGVGVMLYVALGIAYLVDRA